jgi:hypothetical protein
MARGFESKSVADQQEEAENRRRSDGEPEEEESPALRSRRRTLELARANVLHQLEVARAEAHREVLRRALEAVEKDLAELG